MDFSPKEKMIRNDPRPLYEQAQSVLIGRIMDGIYKPGEKLPPEDLLASNMGVSRVTIRSALSHLETLGYIHRIHGGGTFVSQRRFQIEAQLDTLESFHPRMAARMGRSSSISHLDIREVPASEEIAKAMDLRHGDPVISVKRIVEFDSVPVVYLQDFLPTSFCNCTIESLKENLSL